MSFPTELAPHADAPGPATTVQPCPCSSPVNTNEQPSTLHQRSVEPEPPSLGEGCLSLVVSPTPILASTEQEAVTASYVPESTE